MADKLHPLTELILKRMESHPEEFEQQLQGRDSHRVYPAFISRWDIALDIIKNYAPEAEYDTLSAALGKIRMDEAHRWAMDELCNGPARREAERREHEEQVKLHRQMAQQAAVSQAQLYGTSVGNVFSAGTASPTTTGTGLVETIKRTLGI